MLLLQLRFMALQSCIPCRHWQSHCSWGAGSGWPQFAWRPGEGWCQGDWKKGKPGHCWGRQVSIGIKVTSATLPALPVPDLREGKVAAGGQGQNWQWLLPTQMAVAAGDRPAPCGLPCLHFADLLSLPSLPIAGASKLQHHHYDFMCTAMEAWVSPARSKLPGRAAAIVTSPPRLVVQGALSSLPAFSNTNTWQHMCSQKSYQNHTPSLGRQWRQKQPVTDVSCVSEGFTLWHLQNRGIVTVQKPM